MCARILTPAGENNFHFIGRKNPFYLCVDITYHFYIHKQYDIRVDGLYLFLYLVHFQSRAYRGCVVVVVVRSRRNICVSLVGQHINNVGTGIAFWKIGRTLRGKEASRCVATSQTSNVCTAEDSARTNDNWKNGADVWPPSRIHTQCGNLKIVRCRSIECMNILGDEGTVQGNSRGGYDVCMNRKRPKLIPH